MIDFTLEEGLTNMQAMLHWFAENELRPVALQADRTHQYPVEVIRKMVEYGLGDHQLPRPSKGSRADKPQSTYRNWIVLTEELAWGDPSALLNMPGPGLGGPPVRIMGTEEQKERFFAPFADKAALQYGAYALTEPGAGTDAANIQTTATRDGDHYILQGTKCFITNGARAAWVVVFATVDKNAGRAGQRAFVVERGTPGFRVGKIEDKMGLRASETAELVFDECRVPVANLLGGEEPAAQRSQGGGFVGAMKTFDATRPAVGAMAIGIARGALELAQAHVKEHYMIGRPIPRYHLLAETLAQNTRRLHAARLACWRAGWMADCGHPNSKEASMAKALAAQTAMAVCRDAIQITGAVGTTQALLCEKFFRDIKVYDIFEGTAQAQRLVIVKRLIENLGRFSCARCAVG